MLIAKRPIAAFTVLAFFAVAILCTESARAALRPSASIASRASERGHAPAGQRKALKRTVYAESAAPSSESLRGQWRYVSAKTRAVEPDAPRRMVFSGTASIEKVSTNVFLSVLNL
jgi:hypothetical protein